MKAPACRAARKGEIAIFFCPCAASLYFENMLPLPDSTSEQWNYPSTRLGNRVDGTRYGNSLPMPELDYKMPISMSAFGLLISCYVYILLCRLTWENSWRLSLCEPRGTQSIHNSQSIHTKIQHTALASGHNSETPARDVRDQNLLPYQYKYKYQL